MGFKDGDKKTLSIAEEIVYKKYFETDSVDVMRKYREFFYEFRQWAYWYPDKFLDMFGDENFELDLDQRLTLRLMTRGQHSTFIQSRGTGKSFVAFLYMVVVSILLPNHTIIFVAQTREASARTMSSKFIEATRMIPFIKNEIVGDKPTKDSKEIFELDFKNGSKIKNGIAGEGSRGDRGHVLIIDERGFVSTDVIDDVMKPIISEARKSLKDGRQGIHEFNGMKGISSAGYYGSSAHHSYLKGYKINAEEGDNFTLATDYRVPLMFGRAFDTADVAGLKKSMSKLKFDMNMLSNFGGSGSGGGLVAIEDLERCRTLEKPEFRADGKHDYLFAYDVARNWNTGKTDDSALIIGKLFRGSNGDVARVAIVNIITLSANMNFEKQSETIKKMDSLFNPLVIVADVNSIGMGIYDELQKETVIDGDVYPAYNTMNTPDKPECENYVDKLYALQSSRKETKNSDIIKNGIDIFAKAKVELLVQPQTNVVNPKNKDDFLTEELPLYETAAMIEEILNIEVKYREKSDTLTISQRAKGINKDKIMATLYLLFYAFELMKSKQDKKVDTKKYLSLWR